MLWRQGKTFGSTYSSKQIGQFASLLKMWSILLTGEAMFHSKPATKRKILWRVVADLLEALYLFVL